MNPGLLKFKITPRVVKAGKKEAPDNKKSEKILLFVKLSIIAIGVTLLVLGICGDGIKGTLEKAIRICTECIGLG